MKIFRCFWFIFSILMVSISCGELISDKEYIEKSSNDNWLTEGVIYQIQPRAFTPEGTLKAATEKLRFVKELGVSIIYLCPVFVADYDQDTTTWSPRQKASGMNNPRNPYKIIDYFNVDPEYGTNDDLKDFIDHAHELDLRVMLDMVYYHCGLNAVFLEENPDFIHRDINGDPILGHWNWPALNFESRDLREYLYKNMEYWVKDFNVDGFRLDVACRVPLDFWEESKTRLKEIDPDIKLFNECNETSELDGQVHAFDLTYSFLYQFALKDVFDKDQSVSIMRSKWEEVNQKVRSNSQFARYFDNHDLSNNDYFDRREKKWGYDACQALMVHIFTLDGVPFLYNGQEIADSTRHSIFGSSPINWDIGNELPAIERKELIRKLIELRINEVSLLHGTLNWVDNNKPEQILSYSRKYGDEELLIVLNLSNNNCYAKLDFGSEQISSAGFKSIMSDLVSYSNDFQAGFLFSPYGYWIGRKVQDD